MKLAPQQLNVVCLTNIGAFDIHAIPILLQRNVKFDFKTNRTMKADELCISLSPPIMIENVFKNQKGLAFIEPCRFFLD